MAFHDSFVLHEYSFLCLLLLPSDLLCSAFPPFAEHVCWTATFCIVGFYPLFPPTWGIMLFPGRLSAMDCSSSSSCCFSLLYCWSLAEALAYGQRCMVYTQTVWDSIFEPALCTVSPDSGQHTTHAGSAYALNNSLNGSEILHSVKNLI